MLFLYLIATLPVILGAFFWIFSGKICWWEWLICSVVAFTVSGFVHAIAFYGQTTDVETWSGEVVAASRTPYWHRTWRETETYTTTDSKGHTHTHTRRVTKTESRLPTWSISTNIGDFSIAEAEYNSLYRHFGKESKQLGHRPDMDSGDPYDYFLVNTNNYFQPVNTIRRWENRIKASPSVYSFPKVDKSEPVFEYPKNTNLFQSNRLLGTAKTKIDILAFDRMNSRLGPVKYVNVILIGFDNDSVISHKQEAKWIGGKQNDLVLCYGNGWSYVFGWTEETLVKRNLETILLQNPIDNDILPKIEQEIMVNYQIRDWKQFSYLAVEPPVWSFIVLIGVICLTQGGLWFWFHVNEINRESSDYFSNLWQDFVGWIYDKFRSRK